MDIGNLRTDVTDNGLEVPMIDYQQNSFNAGGSFKGFPSTGLLSGSMTTLPAYAPSYLEVSSFIPQSYNIAYVSQIPNQNEQKWL